MRRPDLFIVILLGAGAGVATATAGIEGGLAVAGIAFALGLLRSWLRERAGRSRKN